MIGTKSSRGYNFESIIIARTIKVEVAEYSKESTSDWSRTEVLRRKREEMDIKQFKKMFTKKSKNLQRYMKFSYPAKTELCTLRTKI